MTILLLDRVCSTPTSSPLSSPIKGTMLHRVSTWPQDYAFPAAQKGWLLTKLTVVLLFYLGIGEAGQAAS